MNTEKDQMSMLDLPIDAPTKAYPKRIRVMWQMFGKMNNLKCADCVFLERHTRGNTWFKCGKSRVSGSNATDWGSGWTACGLHKETTTHG